MKNLDATRNKTFAQTDTFIQLINEDDRWMDAEEELIQALLQEQKWRTKDQPGIPKFTPPTSKRFRNHRTGVRIFNHARSTNDYVMLQAAPNPDFEYDPTEIDMLYQRTVKGAYHE